MIKEGERPKYLYFLIEGEVLNVNLNRVYGDGSMIGDADIIMNRQRALDTIITLKDSFFVRIAKEVVLNMVCEFPEIAQEMMLTVKSKETVRLDPSLFYEFSKTSIGVKRALQKIYAYLKVTDQVKE